MVSDRTKSVAPRDPQNRWPVGYRASAQTTTPTVPAIVTMSGVTPQRSRKRATGVKIFVAKARP